MFTLRLAACSDCASQFVDYSLHPWFPILFEYGYDEFISPEEIIAYKARANSAKG
jgi:hypothetical protein